MPRPLRVVGHLEESFDSAKDHEIDVREVIHFRLAIAEQFGQRGLLCAALFGILRIARIDSSDEIHETKKYA